MGKNKTKDGAGNKGGKTQWQKQIDRLKEIAGPRESIPLFGAISEPILYDWLNEALDTALKAAGLDVDLGYRNFAKLICIQLFSYSREDYLYDIQFQRTLTRDILEMTEDRNGDSAFPSAMYCFDLLRNITGSGNAGPINLTDNQLKDFFVPTKQEDL